MDNRYREMLDEAALLTLKKEDTSVEKKYFNKIIITKTDFPDSDKRCFTIEIKEDLFNNDGAKERTINELSAIIIKFFEKYGIGRNSAVLVAALGNDKVTADSLGCAVNDKLLVTSHLYDENDVKKKYGNLMSIKCGVSGTTGIASYDVLSSVSERLKPDIIIAVDTLACGSVARLGHTVQISDNGIEPGGGVGNAQTRLSDSSLGIPVIAIGVPLVIYAKKIIMEYLADKTAFIDKSVANLVVTTKEVDFQISDFSYVVAEAINRAVHRSRD